MPKKRKRLKIAVPKSVQDEKKKMFESHTGDGAKYKLDERSIERALILNNGMIRATADTLGCTRQAIYNWLKKVDRLAELREDLITFTGVCAIDNISTVIIDKDGTADPDMKNENSKWWYMQFLKEGSNVPLEISVSLDETLKRFKQEQELQEGKNNIGQGDYS